MLRRKGRVLSHHAESLQIRDLEINPGKMQAWVNREPLGLTFTEFKILQCLAENSGWVCTRQQLLTFSRGEEAFVTDRTIDVALVSLRKKLGSLGTLIETVRGVGYRFKEGE